MRISDWSSDVCSSDLPVDGYFYVGITTRSWKTRWAEHRRAMRKGCNLLFHRKLREELEAKRVTYIHHKVMAVTTDVEALYEAEEALVRGHWDEDRKGAGEGKSVSVRVDCGGSRTLTTKNQKN